MRSILFLTATMLLASVVSPGLFAQEEFSRYEITAKLDPKTHTLSGTLKLGYINDTKQELEELTFFLMGNFGGREQNPYIHPALQDSMYVKGFDPTWTRIISAQDGAGQPLEFELEALPPFYITFSLKDVLLRVQLPQPLEPGRRTEISIEFETKFAQALIADNSVYRGIYIWRFGWNPIVYSPEILAGERFELPAAHYRVELTVPKEFVVAAGAERQEIIAEDDQSKTLLLENEVPVRSVPLVMGRDLKHFRLHWRDVVIDSYHLAGGEGYGRLAAAYAAEILEYFERHFGPYGYKRLVIVENPAPWGLFGMAADGMILLGTRNYRFKDVPVPGALDRLLEALIAHEIAHLWWGIGVGADFNAENWLSEGFAQYLELTYFEDKYGAFEPNLFAHLGEGLLEELIRSRFGYYNARRHGEELPYLELLREGFDEPIIKPIKDVEYYNGQTVRIYDKGYLVLRALEGLLGQEVMFEVLREAYKRFNKQIPRVEDFRALAEELSGRDLKGFFTSWLYGTDVLDIAAERFTSRPTGEGYETIVYLSKRGAAVYPVVIRAITAEGEELEETWSADSPQGTVSFTSASRVVRIHVDPGEMSPDANRFDNHLPRRVIIKHPFMREGWKIGNPLDAYLIELSPLGVSGRFRTDHQWSLSLFPMVMPEEEEAEEAAEAEEEEAERLRPLWNGVGFFMADLGRELSLDALAALIEYDPQKGEGFLMAQLGLNFTLYEHPPIGIAGKYWWPANLLRASLGALGDLPEPVVFLELDYIRLDLLRYFMLNAVSLQLGIDEEPFGLVEWSGFKRHRLAHMLYMDAEFSLGTGLLAKLPEPFQFTLPLYSFEERFPNDRMAFGRVGLVLPPLKRDWGYSLLNLAKLDQVQLGLFVQGGQTWALDEPIELSAPKAEAGVEATVVASSFLGFPLSLTIGYAHPIIGEDEPDGEFFISFFSPF
jgi:hypothetical protein